jgi:hypothetical protein
MIPVMVKEPDLACIDVAENYEVLDATALSRRVGFKRDTVLVYLSRRTFRRIPRPNRQLAMGPIWGTRRASKIGKRRKRRVRAVASRGTNSESHSWGEG